MIDKHLESLFDTMNRRKRFHTPLSAQCSAYSIGSIVLQRNPLKTTSSYRESKIAAVSIQFSTSVQGFVPIAVIRSSETYVDVF